ncbi:MAG: DinB family protein [Thermoanaerobaculia bacterium]
MVGPPERDETAPYYHRYIDRVPGGDVVGVLAAQLDDTLALLRGISEERSFYRYAPEKWSIRQVMGHVNDTERVFLFRALWFARGFDSPLPSFDQNDCAGAARADEVPWAGHIEEFRGVRLATLAFFRNLPADAWTRRGVASGNPFTVRALAYIVAGHLAHHVALLQERYA